MRKLCDRLSPQLLKQTAISVAVSVIVWGATSRLVGWWLPSGPTLESGDAMLKREFLDHSLFVYVVILVVPVFHRFPKLFRATFVVLSLVLSSTASTFLLRNTENLISQGDVELQSNQLATLATRFWVVVVILQFATCAWFGWTHLRHIRLDSVRYFEHFKALSRKNFSGEDPNKSEGDDLQLKKLRDHDVEGESTIRLLLTIIYGILAMTGSTIAYFTIGQHLDLVQENVPFIFKNNEGFTAALSLLIIVLTSAAVPIYSDLAKKIDDDIQSFERDVSVLGQNLSGLSIGGDAIWKHFTDVGLPLFEEWRQAFEEQERHYPHFLAEAHLKQLFLPYLIYQVQRQDRRESFDNYPPRLLEPFVSLIEGMIQQGTSLRTLFRGLYQQLGEELANQGHEYFFATSDYGHSRARVNSWLTDWHLDAARENEVALNEHQQIKRARLLKFMAFDLQGSSAVAGLRVGEGEFETLYQRPNEGYRDTPIADRLVPSSEHILFELLKYPSLRMGEGGSASLNAFRSRIRRHLNDIQKTESDIPSSERLAQLVGICDELDIDASVFCDDLILFQQINWAIPQQSPPEPNPQAAALSRFLYYTIWYFSAFDTRTRVGQLLNAHGEPDGVARAEEVESDAEEVESNAEAVAPVSAPEIRERLEELHARLSRGEFDSDRNEHKFVSLLLADRRSALHNWIRAAQAHRSRRFLCEFEAKLDEINNPRQLGIPIIPDRSARISHLRYVVRAPRSVRHPLRLVSTFDLLPEISSEARKRATQIQFDRRVIAHEFRQLQDLLQFSRNWLRDCRVDRATVLRPFLEALRDGNVDLPEIANRLRAYLEWICRVTTPQIDPTGMADFELLRCSLEAVSYRFRVTQGLETNNVWQNQQWQQFRDYCIDPGNEQDIRATFFPRADPSMFEDWQLGLQQRFDDWAENFH